jgi:hypothetical protein
MTEGLDNHSATRTDLGLDLAAARQSKADITDEKFN